MTAYSRYCTSFRVGCFCKGFVPQQKPSAKHYRHVHPPFSMKLPNPFQRVASVEFEGLDYNFVVYRFRPNKAPLLNSNLPVSYHLEPYKMRQLENVLKIISLCIDIIIIFFLLMSFSACLHRMSNWYCKSSNMVRFMNMRNVLCFRKFSKCGGFQRRKRIVESNALMWFTIIWET